MFQVKENAMIESLRYKRLGVLIMFSACLLMLSCAPKSRVPASRLDTPDHHFTTGMKLLDQEKFGDARRSFELALELDPRYAGAHAGIGLVKAHQEDYKGGFAAMDKAWKYAGTPEERLFIHIGFIRINTLSHAHCMQVGVVCRKVDKDWLDLSRDEFEKAVLIDPASAAAHYHMGLCYKTALDVVQASQMFSKVLDLRKEYTDEADQQFNLMQKIQRALPGSITGKQIAFVEKITRADAAALFMEELKIDNLYKKRTPKRFDTGFKDPEKAAAKPKAAPLPADIAGHPLRADIEGILEIGVRGLETYPDGLFRPDNLIERAAYAMMIEDILIKVSGDNTLATRFIGSASPFPDLRSDLPYFNAVMVVTARQIMGAQNMTTGEFVPMGPVGGADALLIIRKIREELKF
jgi:tetratricopeptide (TPR) repeat protein